MGSAKRLPCIYLKEDIMSKKDTKFEGVKVIGGKDGYNPDKKVEEKEYTSPVRIAGKDYVIKRLSMLDVKQLNIERKKLKKDDEMATYDFGFYTLLTVIKKFNPEAKNITVEKLEDMIDIVEFEKVQAAILQISGLKKFFKPGDSGK